MRRQGVKGETYSEKKHMQTGQEEQIAPESQLFAYALIEFPLWVNRTMTPSWDAKVWTEDIQWPEVCEICIFFYWGQ